MFFELEPSANVALVAQDGEEWTYAQLAGEVSRLASALPARSLGFILCQNTPGCVVGYLGFLNGRSVPLMLDRKIDRALLAHLLEVYQPEYLYVPEDIREEFPESEELDAYPGSRLLHRPIETRAELADELALLLTTSGSTGSPKLVRQSYTNIQSNAEAIKEYLDLTSDERPVTTLPMNYTYGLSIVNSHMLVGATLLMTDAPMTNKTFWDFMKAQKATSFGGVPFTYEMLKRLRFFRMDLPDLRYMTQAGGRLSPELHKEYAEWCAERGKKFIVMYGQTEATARMSYLPWEKSLEKIGSMGVAIPGGKFTLMDVNDNEITEPNVTGEMIYEGPNVTLGYAQQREDLAKEDERHGVLATGDMAMVDEDGFYFITGRKSRFLKIYGNRVNLDETELLLKKNFPGMELAAAGTDDNLKVYITEESRVDEIRRWVANTTHLSEKAVHVICIPEIPKNEVGKIQYKQLN